MEKDHTKKVARWEFLDTVVAKTQPNFGPYPLYWRKNWYEAWFMDPLRGPCYCRFGNSGGVSLDIRFGTPERPDAPEPAKVPVELFQKQWDQQVKKWLTSTSPVSFLDLNVERARDMVRNIEANWTKYENYFIELDQKQRRDEQTGETAHQLLALSASNNQVSGINGQRFPSRKRAPPRKFTPDDYVNSPPKKQRLRLVRRRRLKGPVRKTKRARQTEKTSRRNRGAGPNMSQPRPRPRLHQHQRQKPAAKSERSS